MQRGAGHVPFLAMWINVCTSQLFAVAISSLGEHEALGSVNWGWVMKKFAMGAFVWAAFAAPPAAAATLTFNISDLTTHAGYTTANTGQTYSGTGFVGMYNSNIFNHLFGIEGQSSKTLAQVGISGLQGAVINSAFLTFNLLDGGGNTVQPLTLTAAAGTGTIGYQFSAPAATYGTLVQGVSRGVNSVNVTSLLSAAVAANEDWLNLHFQSTDCCLYTYTDPLVVGGRSADSALVRLVVDYSQAATGAVPEPSTWAMLILGFGLLGNAMRRRSANAAASRTRLTYA